MENVIQSRGQFTLIRTEDGFSWRLTTLGGQLWYWHPRARCWFARHLDGATEADAAAELDWALSHENAVGPR